VSLLPYYIVEAATFAADLNKAVGGLKPSDNETSFYRNIAA
jgi:hypothetical protein